MNYIEIIINTKKYNIDCQRFSNIESDSIEMINRYLQYFKNNIECWRKLCLYEIFISIEMINEFKEYFKDDIECWRHLTWNESINSIEMLDEFKEYFKNDIECWEYLCFNRLDYLLQKK